MKIAEIKRKVEEKWKEERRDERKVSLFSVEPVSSPAQ